jgi:translocation and assembly module TamA
LHEVAGWLLVLTFWGHAAHASDPQPYEVIVAGTGDHRRDEALQRNAELVRLRTIAPVGPGGLVARARNDVDRLKTVLESFGYYQGTVTVTIDGSRLDDPRLIEHLTAAPPGPPARCEISFEPGPLYHLGRIEVEPNLPDDVTGARALSPGAAAVAEDVLAAARRLLDALQDRGFAFAVAQIPVARLDTRNHLVNVEFHIEQGPRVKFGSIRFTGLARVRESALRARLDIHTGDEYNASKLEKGRQGLLRSGLFSYVSVELGKTPDFAGQIPVTFDVHERARRTFGIRASYSSDLGGSGGITWSNRDVFHGGERLDLAASATNVGGNASQGVGYDINARYTLPDFWRKDQALQLGASALQQSLQAYDQVAQIFSVTLNRRLTARWKLEYGVSASYDKVRQQEQDFHYALLAFPVTFGYDSTDLATPLSDPTRGIRASVRIAPTVAAGHPNSKFLITTTTIIGFLDVGAWAGLSPGRSVLALRATGSLASGAGQYDLPPDQRFYAGGSGTIRGFRYQSVGPQFADGNPTGGTAMDSLGIELRHRLNRHLGIAIFADGGEVSQSTDPFAGDFRVGVGAGLRFYSPIGPIRLDVAVPTARRPGDDSFEIYVGVGQAF